MVYKVRVLQTQCIFSIILMRCILIGPIIELIFMQWWSATDLYDRALGSVQWSKMPCSLWYNCCGSAITVLHSKLVSPSFCSFLPHAELCASDWRPQKLRQWQPHMLTSAIICAMHFSYWAGNRRNDSFVPMVWNNYIPFSSISEMDSGLFPALHIRAWTEIM